MTKRLGSGEGESLKGMNGFTQEQNSGREGWEMVSMGASHLTRNESHSSCAIPSEPWHRTMSRARCFRSFTLSEDEKTAAMMMSENEDDDDDDEEEEEEEEEEEVRVCGGAGRAEG